MEYRGRFTSWAGSLLEVASYLLSYPGLVAASLAISVFISPRPDTRPATTRAVAWALLGPGLSCLALLLAPAAVLGWLLWVLACLACPARPATSLSWPPATRPPHQAHYTAATMNVLLGQEAIGRFNNCGLVYRRLGQLAGRLLQQGGQHLANLQTADNITREETVLSTFPRQASNTISPFPLLVLFPEWTSFVYKKYLTHELLRILLKDCGRGKRI